MKPMQAVLHAIRAHGVAQRKFLRIARKLHGGSVDFQRGGPLFPGASDEQENEIAELYGEMEMLQARIFALFPGGDYSLEADLQALANIIANEATSDEAGSSVTDI